MRNPHTVSNPTDEKKVVVVDKRNKNSNDNLINCSTNLKKSDHLEDEWLRVIMERKKIEILSNNIWIGSAQTQLYNKMYRFFALLLSDE